MIIILTIDTWRDPYCEGFNLIKPKQIQINSGLTVLVGCNGSGKTTLLHNIKDHCKKNNIPVLSYDNLHDGGRNSASEILFNEQYNDFANLFTSSEGEAIKINVGRTASRVRSFIENGYVNTRYESIIKCLNNNLEEEREVLKNCEDRVLLFDAVDSGLSVDAIVEVKDLFSLILDDSKNYNKNVYIIISANEYELARDVDCFDVNKGKYLRFKDYEDYRKHILESRKRKDKRYGNDGV